MADDDDKNGSDSDPWADIESGTSPDLTDGLAFSFEEPVESSAEPGDADGPAEGVDDELVDSWLTDGDSTARAVERPTPDRADEPSRPLGVFDPDGPDTTHHDIPGSGEDVVAASSTIDIGTGFSGVDPRSGIGPSVETDASDAIEWLESSAASDDVEAGLSDRDTAVFVEHGGESSADDGSSGAAAPADVIDFATAVPAAAGVAAAVGSGPKPAGFGRLAGILLGGLASIPIALGILVWGLQLDPLGVTRMVPDSLSFLLPAGLRAAPAPGPVVASLSEPPIESPAEQAVAAVVAAVLPEEAPAPLPAAPSPSDLAGEVTGDPATVASDPEPLAGDAAGAAPAVEPPLPVDATAGPLNEAVSPPVVDESALEAPAPPTAEPVASVPVAGESPLTDPPTAASKPADVAVADRFETEPTSVSRPVDDLFVMDPTSGPTSVSQPADGTPTAGAVSPAVAIDTTAFAQAVADASAARMAVDAVPDPADPARKPLLVRWYKSLARLGEALADLQRAADGGGTPAEALAASAGLSEGLSATDDGGDELARLALDWLAYSRRPSAGIVMRATVTGVRRAGPLWAARCTLSDAAGRSRAMAVICRDEPGAGVGDSVVVTGVVLDDGVVWAADMRPVIGGMPGP